MDKMSNADALCANPSDPQIISLCACKTASDKFADQWNKYDQKYQDYLKDMESYNRFSQIHQAWQNQTKVTVNGKDFDYTKWKDKDTNEKFMPGYCWRLGCYENLNLNDARWQCGNDANNKGLPYAWDYAPNGNEVRGCDNHSDDNACVKWRKQECERTADSIKKANDQWKQDEPGSDLSDPNSKSWLTLGKPTEPTPPSGSNIMCCTQLFTDIQAGGNASFKDINQTCSQKLEQSITSGGAGSSPVPAPGPGSTPGTGSKSSSNATTIIWIVVGFLAVICCFVIIFLLLSSDNAGDYDGDY